MSEEDAIMRAMYGEQARHAAFNYVVQGEGKNNRAAIIGNTSFAKEMSFGGDLAAHTLVLCDVIIRPHLVITSRHLLGTGAAGILTSGMASAEPWMKNGKILINNIKPPHNAQG